MLKYLIATSRLKISKLQMYLKTLLSSIRDQSMYWNSKWQLPWREQIETT